MKVARPAALAIALHGTPASSPGAFQIAAGTPVRLHMRSGTTISGEIARDDARTVSLDSGRIVVAKADVHTVETRGDYEVKPKHAIDEYGNKAAPKSNDDVVQGIVSAVVLTMWSLAR